MCEAPDWFQGTADALQRNVKLIDQAKPSGDWDFRRHRSRTRVDLLNPQWRIGSSNDQGLSARIVRADGGNSMLGPGRLVKGGHIRHDLEQDRAAGHYVSEWDRHDPKG